MSHSTNQLTDAGKITVFTTLIGVVIFGVVFFFSLGEEASKRADAQSDTATTSVTVLNTPPSWTGEAREEIESSTSSPTNVGDVVTWVATGTDANSEPYYLLICSNSATPTANSGAAPECDAPTNQWAVSTSTVSGTQARVSTTTQTAWAEQNDWYGWICDDNAGTPRCITYFTQGTTTPSFASPFAVNHRPTFSVFIDDSPADPGAVVNFYSTSTDPDTSGGQDQLRLHICNDPDFDTSTDSCGPGGYIASTSVAGAYPDASAQYTIVIPTQDQDYTAYGYIVDEHGFEASGGSQGTDSTLTVNNVAPTTASSTISINGGAIITLTVASGETTGFTFQYTATDDNSCLNALSEYEAPSSTVALYRSGVGSTTCDGTAGAYDPNNCYTSSLATTTWNFVCTASSTTCTGATDPDQIFECTFPLWYIADPTVAATQYPTENWLAQVRAIDDDYATGTYTERQVGVELDTLLAFNLNTITIPYGTLEPGQQTDPIVATTTIAATGNVGLDEDLSGDSMCTTYAATNTCASSATSTIPENQQVFATSTVTYAQGTALSSTTPFELEVNTPKSIATSTATTSNTFWGIAVPGTITLSGDYTGQNTFTAIVGEAVDW